MCLCASVFVCIHVRVGGVCVGLWVCLNVSMCGNVHACVRMCVCLCVHVHVRVYVCVNIRLLDKATCIHQFPLASKKEHTDLFQTHTHTRTHTHTHTLTLARPVPTHTHRHWDTSSSKADTSSREGRDTLRLTGQRACLTG